MWDGYFKAWPASNEQDIKTYWERKPWHPDALRMYGFTGSAAHSSPPAISLPRSMSCTLNEIRPIDKDCAPTDARWAPVRVLRCISTHRARNRPDVRLMEEAEWERANEACGPGSLYHGSCASQVKGQLEEAQRKRRKEMEKSMQQWEPRWFHQLPDPVLPGRSYFQYKGGYWEAKEAGTWDAHGVPDIYRLEPK